VSTILSLSIIETPDSSVIRMMTRKKFSDGETLLVWFQTGAIYQYLGTSFESFWTEMETALEKGESIGQYFNKAKKSPLLAKYTRVK